MAKKIIREINYERILFFQPNFNFTIYDLLAHTDVMITDYTSMYFDFLLTGRPVIFNFSDKDIYEKDRGFSYDPIEIVCAGEIANNEQELMNAIQKSLHNDANISIDKYLTIRKITNKYCDFKSTQRVVDFLVSITEKN
jgi:CDP-glycerol glycerophosphotransferase (TagB/SpsB family)